MDEQDRKKQAAVLAEIAKLPEGATIEEWNKRRLSSDILTAERQKIRASFFVPKQQRIH